MSQSFKKQLPLNLISNIVFFALNVFIGIWIVPYFMHHLGAEGFGFISIATAIVAHVSLIKVCLNGAVARFLAIDIQQKNLDDATRLFNTAFWSLGGISLGLVGIFALFALLSPRIFHIPAHLTTSVQALLFLTLLSFIISIFSSILNAPLFAQNRLDLRNAVDVSYLVFRTVFIFLFFFLFSIDLVYVGWAYLAGAVVSLLLSAYLFKAFSSEICISRKYYDRSKLKDVFSMSGWMLIDQVGSILLLQVDVILCNILLGAAFAGYYGAVIQWSVLLRAMASVAGSTLLPMVIISHALDQKERICRIVQLAVKYMGLGLALPIGLIIGFAEPLLSVWLGHDFVQYANLLRLMVFHLIINSTLTPLFGINVALNKMKWPGIVTIVSGVINILMVVFLVKGCGWGVYGIAASGLFVLTVKNATFTPLYAAHLLKLPWFTFLKPMLHGVMMMVLLSGIAFGASIMFDLSSWSGLFGCGSVLALLYLGVVWRFILKPDEKQLLWSFVKKEKSPDALGEGEVA
ncbi:MAG: oligosaccharide flippase family protein [Candidatus Omnitrophica bacterium]|nr:oligosaccharide flippase family protein [Candidatus Omnitrophota bacterium]